MAIAPDPPFPKTRGDAIRSKDWNDAITEVQRLDTAKVNRTGDAITGGLTIGGHAGVGTATPENAEGWDRVLDVLGSQHAKLSVRSAAIEGRMMAHGAIWGAPAGMVVGTNTDHPLSFGTNRSSRMTIDRAGLVGIGVGAQPQARLHVAGGQGDIGLTEGDLKVGDANFRLKVGVTTTGADAGNVRIRAHGGTNRLVLGGGTSDALTIAGANVGIGTITPSTADRLDVAGSLRILTGLNPMRFTSAYSGFPDAATNQAEISNDIGTYKTLMILGNRSAGLTGPGLGRRVSIWDILEVNGNIRLPDHDIHFRGGTDVNHGVGWYGPYTGGYPKSFGGIAPDGPVLYGHGGGALGTTAGGQRLALSWNNAGNLVIPGGQPSTGDRLDVGGTLRILTGLNPIRFTSVFSGFADVATNQAEISNDTSFYKTLMILGNRSAGGSRRVSIWDLLEVNGTLLVHGVAAKPGGGSWAALSDRRLKKAVKPLKGSLDKLLQLRGVSFEWRKPEEQGNLTGPQVGLVAQEVEEVFPEWVDTMPDGFKMVSVKGFEALTIEAMRELRAEVEVLQEKNKDLEARLKSVEKTAAREAKS